MSDLKRYIVEQDLTEGSIISIEGVQFNHMVNVMREKAGDEVIFLNGDGCDYLCRITSVSKNSARAVVLEKQENPRKCRARLTILCGLAKGDANDEQAVKCSELGVYEYVPFISNNCVIGAGSGKAERLSRIALESSKQCKRAVPMKVGKIMGFEEALGYVKDCKIKIIAYECEYKNTLKKALEGKAESAAVFIGPEGGFSPEEINKAVSCGFVPVTLGKTILKADTAAIAAASAVLYELGEWDTDKASE